MNDKVRQHFEHPLNVGAFPADEPGVSTGYASDTGGGLMVRLQIKVKAGMIDDARFKVFGCAYTIAACSLATGMVKGLALPAASQLQASTLAEALDLPADKTPCAELVVEALGSAISDFYAGDGELGREKGWGITTVHGTDTVSGVK